MPFSVLRCLTQSVLLFLILLWAGIQAAQAETLGRLLEKVQSDREGIVVCLQAAVDGLLPKDHYSGGCAGVVSRVYLDALLQQERRKLIEDAIAQQRSFIDLVQRIVEGGGMSSGELLLAEIELKRRQLEEAEVSAAISRSALFFESMQSDPERFVLPRIRTQVWPENREAALAELASAKDTLEDAKATAQRRLKRAWIDYETARREKALLQPMVAFARDLARASQQQFELGRVQVATLQTRFSEAVALQAELLRADYDMLAAQIRILEILGHGNAVE